jgi:hypothetical protein
VNPHIINVVPELNYWMVMVLKNSPVNDVFHKIASQISDYWREPNSVLELLFNENFTPIPKPSSSSSSSSGFYDFDSENERRFIYKYRMCNLLTIPDKNLIYRLQLYRWNSNVFAANSNKFWAIFDMTSAPNRDINWPYPRGTEYYDEGSGIVVLPYDVDEKKRSPYLDYQPGPLFTSNYQLVDADQNKQIPPIPPMPPVGPVGNLFGFTKQDLDILDLLYDYKVGFPITLDGINFYDLTCISKLIYIYLDAFLNNSYQYYDTEDTISEDCSSILCNLYEKYVLDMICQLKRQQYGVIWKDSDVINTTITTINVNDFMIMKNHNERIIVTDEIYTNGEILITEHIPWNRADFLLFKDGKILEQDESYTLQIDFSDPTNIVARCHFLKDIFLPGDRLEMIWSYVDSHSAYSAPDQ